MKYPVLHAAPLSFSETQEVSQFLWARDEVGHLFVIVFCKRAERGSGNGLDRDALILDFKGEFEGLENLL